MNKNMYKRIYEQFNIKNMDFGNIDKRKKNIFNKNIIDPYKIYDDILNKNQVSPDDIKLLESLVSVVNVRNINELLHVVNFYI